MKGFLLQVSAVTLRGDSTATSRSDYAELLSRVRRTGLLTRSPRLYIGRGLALFVFCAAGVLLLVVVGDSWWQIPVAAYWAVMFAQLGFLGHDAGHQQVFAVRRHNDLLGLLVATLGIGLSYSWCRLCLSFHHE